MIFKHLDSDERLKGHHRLDAVRGHLEEMSGDIQRAIASYLSVPHLEPRVSPNAIFYWSKQLG